MAGSQDPTIKDEAWSPSPNTYKPGYGYIDEINRLANGMSQPAIVRRRLFAAHYIKTADLKASAEFAGFSNPSYGSKVLKEPYVQHLLHNMLDQLDQDAIMSQNEVLFRFKEEAIGREDSSATTRVTALSGIAKIRGMMVDRHEVTTKNSGVMVVPAVPSVDDWSANASKSQNELKESVKD